MASTFRLGMWQQFGPFLCAGGVLLAIGSQIIGLERPHAYAALQALGGPTSLAAHIGPYAEFAVRKLSRTAADLAELCHNLAEEIPDGAARAQFLANMQPARAKLFRPGVMLRSRRNAAGLPVCEPRLKARGELLVLAIPPALAVSMEAGPADATSSQLQPPCQ